MQLQPTAQSPSFLTVEMAISALKQECSRQIATGAQVASENASRTYRPYADWNGTTPFQYTTCSDSVSAVWGAVHCADCRTRTDPNTHALQRRVPSRVANGINCVSDAFLCLGTTIAAVATTTLCGGGALAGALLYIAGANTVGLMARPFCICYTEEILESIALENAMKDHEKTIEKIQRAIEQMSFLNSSSPLSITLLLSHLKNIPLTPTTRKLFTEKMSVMQLKEALQVDQEYAPYLQETQKKALVFLREIAGCDADKLAQFQELLVQDALLFTYVVQTLTESAFNNPSIQGVLTKIQQNHTNQEISQRSLEQIRKEAQAEITCILKGETKTKQVTVSRSTLLQYEYFRGALTYGFKETHTRSITLELPDYELDVFNDLVNYMKTKTICTSDVCALLFLADRLEVGDCMAACTYSLIKRFELESPRYPTLSQCIQDCSMHKHLFEDLVFGLLLRLDLCNSLKRRALLELATTNDFSQCLQKFDQHILENFDNEYLLTALDFNLPHSRAKFISLVADAIKQNCTDFEFLRFFCNYPAYYPTVVDMYLEHLPLSHVGSCLAFGRANKHPPELEQKLSLHLQKKISSENFKDIWDVADAHNLEEVKKACSDFFRTLPDTHEIIAKWPDSACPFDLLATSLATSLASLALSSPDESNGVGLG